MTKYKVYRFYRDHDRRTIKHNLTLAEAQTHCQDPETSSDTCSDLALANERSGFWFDGYTVEGK
jgi:hypothetical protein